MKRRKGKRMLALKRVYVPDAHNPPPISPLLARSSLASREEKLALQERDAVRRSDWSAARSAAEERTILQEARHRAAARRLA